MVMRYGMVEKLGHIAYEIERPSFLDPRTGTVPARDFSEDTAREIDCAVREIVKEAFDKASTILRDNRTLLETWANKLLAAETLSEEDLGPLRTQLSR